MYCTNCGNKIGTEDRYCANCGTARPGKDFENLSVQQVETCIVEGEKTGVGSANRATFWATATGPKGTYIAAATSEFEVDGRYVLWLEEIQRKYGDRPLNSLVNRLENDGWEQQSHPGQNWYSLRFKRVIDRQGYTIFNLVGMFESVALLNRKRHIWMLGSGLAAIIISFFLFDSTPTLGFFFLVVGIATVAVTKLRIEWSGPPSQKKVVAAPGTLLVIGVLVIGYLLGLLI